MPFPAPRGHFANKNEMAEYLERYASRFDLPVRLNTRVKAVRWTGAHYSIGIEGDAPVLEADNVIVATGAFQAPRTPVVSDRLAPTIHQLHSSQYSNPCELPAGSVLIVGALDPQVVVTEMPGLYFVGLRFQHRLNSSLIGGVGDDAAFIAAQVAQRASYSTAQ